MKKNKVKKTQPLAKFHRIKQLLLQLLTWALMLSIFFALLSLGFWQLSRADEKRQLLSASALTKDQPPLLLSKIKPDTDLAFLPVHLKGKWLSQWRFYLDNRIIDGALGYNLFALFKDDSGQIIWVDRGWLAISAERIFRDIQPLSSQRNIAGYIYFPDEYKLLATPELKANHPVAIAGLNLPRLQQVLKNNHIEIAPYIVRQTFPENEQGLIKKWQIVTMPPERHVGYAIQWFLLAIAFAVLVILFRRKNLKKKREL